MSDIEELIAEARRDNPGDRLPGSAAWTIRRLADALEAAHTDSTTGQMMHAHWQERAERAEAERDALAAFWEEVQGADNEYAHDYVGYVDFRQEVQDALRRAPDSALREHDAALIENLADGYERQPEGERVYFPKVVSNWLREQAQKRREGENDE